MRVKLGLLIFGMLVVFGFVVDRLVIAPIQTADEEKLHKLMNDGYKTYVTARAAGRLERLEHAVRFAAEPEIVEVMDRFVPEGTPEAEALVNKRHFDLFEALDKFALAKHKADLVIGVDKSGVELARTATGKWLKERFNDYKVVAEALLHGKAGEDIWYFESDRKIRIVTVAPILRTGEPIGAIIWCNDINSTIAQKESLLVPGFFGFFYKNGVLGSTLESKTQKSLEDWFTANQGPAADMLSATEQTMKKIVLNDQLYMALFAPLRGEGDKVTAGFMILRNLDEWNEPFDWARIYLLILSLILVLACVPWVLIIIQRAYDTVNFILEGAHQIILGNKDYQFGSNDETLNSLGQSLNLMIAILLGKYIPEDEEEVDRNILGGGAMDGQSGRRDKPRPVLIENIDASAKSTYPIDAPAEIAELSEEEYYKKLYEEFVAAKQKLGEDVSQITVEKLKEKLTRAEVKLIEKHNCKRVRFAVAVEGNKVSFKPNPIWDKEQ